MSQFCCCCCQQESDKNELPQQNNFRKGIQSSYNPIKVQTNKRNSRIQEEKFRQQYLSEYDDSYGLPNLSQTCYLNTALQLIQSINGLLSQKDPEKDKKFHRLLKKVFDLLPQTSNTQKRKALESLVTELGKLDLHRKVDFKKENDLIFILNLLLEQIIAEDQQTAQKITLTYKKHCGCQELDLFYDERLFSVDEVCARCKQVIQVEIEVAPSYLIVSLGDDSPKKVKDEIVISYKSQRQRFSLVAYGIYSKKNECGHYRTVKQVGGQWKMIDDSHVFPCQANPSYEGRGRVAVYKKI